MKLTSFFHSLVETLETLTSKKPHKECEILKKKKLFQVNAYVALVVVSFPDLQTVHQDCQPVKITQPYIPGFLAFREIDHFIYILQKLKQDKPDHFPQVIFIDGNGLLHPRECGIACQLGVETGCVTVGCAKNLYMMDSITRDAKHKTQIEGVCLIAFLLNLCF